QVTVWLAYMPTKLRVLHGHLEFSENTLTKLPKLKKLKTWEPTDLPQVIQGLCEQFGVRFIDLTPALIKETIQTGQLLYNSLDDTHLNKHGSHVVGEELTRNFIKSVNLSSPGTKRRS